MNVNQNSINDITNNEKIEAHMVEWMRHVDVFSSIICKIYTFTKLMAVCAAKNM